MTPPIVGAHALRRQTANYAVHLMEGILGVKKTMYRIHLLVVLLLSGLIVALPAGASDSDDPFAQFYETRPHTEDLLAAGELEPLSELPADFGSDQYLTRTYGVDAKEAGLILAPTRSARSIQPDLEEKMWRPMVIIDTPGVSTLRTAYGAVINFANAQPEVPAYCVDLAQEGPVGLNGTVRQLTGDELSQLSKYSPPARYALTTAQVAQVLKAYGSAGTTTDALDAAAVALLVHVNFEQSANADEYVGAYLATWESNIPDIDLGTTGAQRLAAAERIAAWARSHTPVTWDTPELVRTSGPDRALLTKVAVRDAEGNPIPGIPFTAVLNGGARFDSDNSTVLEGTTGSEPVSLPIHMVSNGAASAKINYRNQVHSLVYSKPTESGYQSTISTPTRSSTELVVRKSANLALAGLFIPAITSDVSGAFVPMPTQTDAEASPNYLVVDRSPGIVGDHLLVTALPNQPVSLWIGVGGTLPGDPGYQPIPIKFTGVAYHTGEEPPEYQEDVPADAVEVARLELTADRGPGLYSVSSELPDSFPAGGFITWVWSMDPSAQTQVEPEDRRYLPEAWHDVFGATDEITSVRWPGKVESNLKVHETNDHTYLVDDVWISKLPASHPDFAGERHFGADHPEIKQELYFWPEGTPILPGSTEGADLIGATKIPAANGFYPSVGNLEYRLRVDEEGRPTPGTYQVVHSFPGDDRVSPFQSPIPDRTEQHVVTRPSLHTTATDLKSGKKVVAPIKSATVRDQVCYQGLDTDLKYTLTGTLVNRKTEQPVSPPVTKEFTPAQPEGCIDVELPVSADQLAGSTLVAFEELSRDGTVLARHADLDDEVQTVTVGTPPKPLAKTGVTGTFLWIVGLGLLGLGASLLYGVRRS